MNVEIHTEHSWPRGLRAVYVFNIHVFKKYVAANANIFQSISIPNKI